MSDLDPDPVLEIADLLDSSRLAAAWQRARDRAAAVRAGAVARAPSPDGGPSDLAAAADPTGSVPPVAPVTQLGPTGTPPLSVARAHHQLREEVERLLGGSPGLGRHARS